MLRCTFSARHSGSTTFRSLGRLPARARPSHPQRAPDGRAAMGAAALYRVTRAADSRAIGAASPAVAERAAELLSYDDDSNAVTGALPAAAVVGDSSGAARRRREEMAHRLRGQESAWPPDAPYPAVWGGSHLSNTGQQQQPQQLQRRAQPRRVWAARFADPTEEEPTARGSPTSPSYDALVAPPGTDRRVAAPAEEEGEDDDVVMDTPSSLYDTLSSPLMAEDGIHRQRGEAAAEGTDAVYQEAQAQHHHPSARGIAQDVVDLVTDAFKEQREREVARRREALYTLTHPDPADYTYGDKLVPPPPLNFGRITDEAVTLGRQLMLDAQYSLVNQAGVRAEEHDSSGASSSTSGGGMIEVGGRSSSSSSKSRHRNRKREENIFRDHNYFFEINELYQEIVLVGKASAGKSSLINALLGQPLLAKTSSTPNTTRKINFYQSVTPDELQRFHERQHHNHLVKLPGGGRQLTFVDMPGYGIEGMSDKWRDAAIELTDAYFGVRRSVNTVLFCIDCERGLTKTDIKYFKWLENVQGVFYIVLTKCDSVPHSRVCSVMRQVYVLITKHRNKFRKVFPYIIPVSARDGTNMDLLRGLITETSGMLPGDKIREILQRRKEAADGAALATEALRLATARAEERTQARALFLGSGSGSSGAGAGAAAAAAPPLLTDRNQTDAVRGDAAGVRAPTVYHLRLNDEDSATRSDGAGVFAPDERAATAEERRQRRERFLAWRRSNPLERAPTPYGDVRYRVNTGLEAPVSDTVRLEYGGAVGHTEEGAAAEGGDSSAHVHHQSEGALPPPATGPLEEGEQDLQQQQPQLASMPRMPTSRVMGLSPEEGGGSGASSSATGGVSKFLDTLEQFSSQARPEKRRNVRKWSGNGRGGAPRFVAEDGDGRLSAYEAGRRVGPALVSLDTDIHQRQSAWKGRQLKELLTRERADAPWEAIAGLRRRAEEEKQQSLFGRMRRKEQLAYLRNAGKVTESFDKFEGEVAMGKYMNEVRQAPTLRSQQQMHLNATAKINYTSMPVGLWKQYGQQDSYWPTPKVLGRDKDESHATHGAPLVPRPTKKTRSTSAVSHRGGRGKRRGGRKE